MKILYIGSSADFHIDLWVKYFTTNHSVFLFSDKEDYLEDQPFDKVTIFHNQGILGGLLNFFKSKSHLLFQLNKLLSVIIFSKKIEKIIDKHNIDIVHAHNVYQGFLTSFVKTRVPIIFTPMGSDIIISAQKNSLYRFMANQAFKRADVVTGDSLLIQKKGFNVGAKKESNYIIQNGVDSSIFYPQANNLRARYAVEKDETLIFSPRGFAEIYNIETILKSCALLIEKGFKLRLMLCYPFKDKTHATIKEKSKDLMIDDKIIWLGSLSYEEMPDYYNLSDIVISVPDSDSSPKSVYEAMFCGKAIIVTDLAWSYEFLGQEECFLRVKPKNEIDLSEAIIKLIEKPEYSSHLSANALKYAKKHYDYQNNMQEMESIMEGLLLRDK